eukprot:4418184-Pleurochrysis_carterae.AAC.1
MPRVRGEEQAHAAEPLAAPRRAAAEQVHGERGHEQQRGVGRRLEAEARRAAGARRASHPQWQRVPRQGQGGPRRRQPREEDQSESSVARHRSLEEGGNIRRHREALWVHAKARAKGIELPKAATAARVSHRVGRAKD